MCRVELSDGPLDPAGLLTEFMAWSRQVGSGAVVSFTGVCRPDANVESIELEAFAGFTESWITSFAHDAQYKFNAHSMVVHRIGRVLPGEPIVFVATCSKHRRQAFEAADYLMDMLKSRAPFWKKSHGPNGSHWIEPRAADYEDATRWDPARQLK